MWRNVYLFFIRRPVDCHECSRGREGGGNGTYLGENTTYEGTPAGPPRNKVLFTTVVAVFQKGQGGTKMLAEQEWSNSLWRTDSSCANASYT